LTGQEKQFIGGQIQTLRSSTAYMVDNDFQRSLMVGEQALRQLPPVARGARGIALYIIAFSQQALGQQDTAIRQLEQAIEESTPRGPAKAQAFLGLSFLYLMAGDLPRMRQTTDHFLAFATSIKEPNAVGGANYAAGLLDYEWDNLRAAETHFSLMVDLRYRANFLGGFSAGLALARIYQLRGEMEQAQKMIDRLRNDILQINNTDLLPDLEAVQAEQWLLQGNVAAATRWAQSF
jgi:ATP/maltotriose-dependent transcriptional regulator MalT